MVSPTVLKGPKGQRFFFNLDGNVGPNSVNKVEDVQLVQMGYFAMGKAAATPPDLKAAASKVVPGAAYSGGATDPLTLAIKAHEASRGGTQDGHVSTLHLGTNAVYDGVHTFMLTALENNILDLMPNDYPRIDKHPTCPGALKAAVKRVLLG